MPELRHQPEVGHPIFRHARIGNGGTKGDEKRRKNDRDVYNARDRGINLSIYTTI